MATSLLVPHGVDHAKGRDPWTEEIKEVAIDIVKVISADRFSASLKGDYRVIEDVLPILLRVAQCYEDRRTQPKSDLDMIIEWQYIARRYDG
jgi:hypothetical protein